MADITATTYSDALRLMYTQKAVEAHVYQGAPLMAFLPKRNDFIGRNMPIFNWYGTPQGSSATFADAQANKTAGEYEEFLMTRVKHYTTTAVSGEALAAGVGSGAHLPILRAYIDGSLMTEKHALGTYLYGNGGGALGQIGSISTTVVTLKNIQDVVNFSLNMEVETSEADGTSGSLQSGKATITALDRDAGTLTTDSNWTSQIATADADDYIFRDGDFGAVVSGLGAWVPSAAPGATAFFGVDRSVDVVRLGGIRYDGSSDGTIEEALINAGARCEREMAQPTHIFMNSKDRADLSRSMGSRARFEKSLVKVGGPRSKVTLGFNSMVLDDLNQPVQVLSDPFCPQGTAWMLDIRTWVLASLGGCPKVLMGDNNKFLRETDDDAYEVRVGYYANLGCHAPGYNCRVTLPS